MHNTYLSAVLYTAFATTAAAQAPELASQLQQQPTTHTWATLDPISKKWCRVVFEDGANKDTIVFSRGTLKSSEENFRTAKGDGPDTIISAGKIDLAAAQTIYEQGCQRKKPAATPTVSAEANTWDIF